MITRTIAPSAPIADIALTIGLGGIETSIWSELKLMALSHEVSFSGIILVVAITTALWTLRIKIFTKVRISTFVVRDIDVLSHKGRQIIVNIFLDHLWKLRATIFQLFLGSLSFLWSLSGRSLLICLDVYVPGRTFKWTLRVNLLH